MYTETHGVLLIRFSRTGPHKDMAGQYARLLVVLCCELIHPCATQGHDLNYLALSGVLSVRVALLFN